MAALQNRGHRTLFFAIILRLCLLCGSLEQLISYRSVSRGDSRQTLILGGIVPVHKTQNGGCGQIAEYGVQYAEAIAYAVETINSNPSLIPGVKLSFEIRDSCERVYTALEQTFLLLSPVSAADGNISYGVSGVVGESESLISIAIANLLHVFNVPQVDFGASAPSLSDKSRYDYFMRTVPPDNFQARALADVVKHFDWSFVVAINSGDIYGREGIKEFMTYFEDRGVNNTKSCIARQAIEIPYPDASQQDYDQAANILLQPYISNASVIVLFGQTETAQGILEAMQRKREAFANKQFVWVGTDGWADYLDEEHKAMAKYVISTAHKTLNSSDFERHFRSLHVENSSNPWLREYWDAFNCSNVAPDVTCRPIDTYVPHTINAVYAFAHAVSKMQKVLCNGTGLCSAILRHERDATSLNGSLLLQYLKNVSFVDETKNLVSFDRNGDPEVAEYAINYLHPSAGSAEQPQTVTMVTSPIGSWTTTPSGTLLTLQHSSFPELRQRQSSCSAPCKTGYYPQFVEGHPGCCWTCQTCPGSLDVSNGKDCITCPVGFIPNLRKDGCSSIPVVYFSISNPWAITVILIGSVGIMITWVVIIVLVLNHTHPVVKASSRELIAILVVGVHLCYVMPFFFIVKPSAPICAIRRFGVGFSFSICFSALFVRTIRIHRIFNREVLTDPLVFVKPLSQVVFALLLVLVQVAMSAIWLGVEQPSARSVYSGASGELKCSENSYLGLSLTLGYNAILLVLATYYAFRARNVPQNFNETRFINLTVYSLVVIWVAFLPVYFGTANLGTVFQTSSILLAIVLSATILLGCLLVTKVYYLFGNLRISLNALQQKQRTESMSIGSITKTAVTAVCTEDKCSEESNSLPQKSIIHVCVLNKSADAFTQTE